MYSIGNNQCFPKVRVHFQLIRTMDLGFLPAISSCPCSVLPQKGNMECEIKRSNYAECYLKVSGTAHEAMKFPSFIYFKLNYADIRKVLKAITCFTLIDFQRSEGVYIHQKLLELLFVIFCDYIAQKIRAHFITIKNRCAAHPLKIYSIKSKGTNTSKFHINSKNNVMFPLGRKFCWSILSYIKYIYSTLTTCPTLCLIQFKTINPLFLSDQCTETNVYLSVYHHRFIKSSPNVCLSRFSMS